MVTDVLAIADIEAIDGIATSYVINYISSFSPFIAGLSPFVIGGIIGVGLLIPILSIYELIKAGAEKFPKNITIVGSGISFGIGAGLVTLGITSPAAIGAIATILSIGITVPLLDLLGKLSKLEDISSKRYSNGLLAFPTQ